MEVERYPRINAAARGVRKPLRQVRRPPAKIARWRYTVKFLVFRERSKRADKTKPPAVLPAGLQAVYPGNIFANGL